MSATSLERCDDKSCTDSNAASSRLATPFPAGHLQDRTLRPAASHLQDSVMQLPHILPPRRVPHFHQLVTQTAADGSETASDTVIIDVDMPPVLEQHLQQCRCSCDHLGYGNYQTLRTLPDGSSSPLVDGFSYQGVDVVPSIQMELNADRFGNVTSKTKMSGGEVGTERRYWCVICALLTVTGVLGLAVAVPLALGFPDSLIDRYQPITALLKDVPLIDGHNDLPWNLRNFIQNELVDFNFASDLRVQQPWNLSRWSHTDLLRLKRGQVGAQFWAAYVPCGSQWKDAVQMTLEQIDSIRRLVEKYSDDMVLATSAHDIISAHREGRIASLIGVEGGHSLGNSLAVLRTLHRSGARYLTLTHTCDTPWASSSVSDEQSTPDQHSLTDFGKLVVDELNRLGMIVDLSHTSLLTARAAIAASRAPVMFSHSSARAICNSTRNVPDHILRQLKINGGVVMVSFYSKFISCRESSSINNVIEHINHIRSVAGVDHVGIGAGYDGIDRTPDGLEDVSRYPNLFSELKKDPSWSPENLRKLAGLNILRVLRQVEHVSSQMRQHRESARESRVDPLKLIFTDAARCSYELTDALLKHRSAQPADEL